MKKFKILFILLVLFISVGSVYADGNFTSIQTEIDNASECIEITQNYVYDNSSDYQLNDGILVNKSNFAINGNGYTVDGAGQARIFNILGNNVTISNLNIINGFTKGDGGAILCDKVFSCYNVNFTNNTAVNNGGAINSKDIIINNCEFDNNNAHKGALFSKGRTVIENTNFFNSDNLNFSLIYATNFLTIDNCSFFNSTAKYATAIYANGIEIKIRNTKFSNLHSNQTGGAVVFKDALYATFENCTFSNTTAVKNGGAIFNDATGIREYNGIMTILNTSFVDCVGDFGGAILQLGGHLYINDTNFIQNRVSFDGAAIYLSFVTSIMKNVLFDSNEMDLESLFNGGGIYLDMSSLEISDSSFISNSKNAVYAYDSKLNCSNITFENNGEAIHCVFSEADLENVTLNNDALVLDDVNYASNVEGHGLEINLINNVIDVENLPSRYDSRDWGWVSSVKTQGQMGSCWTFGACGALESALLKATGIEYDFSENNMQNSMLQYSKYGIESVIEGGIREQALEYILSWIGVFPTEYDTYDELGKISPMIITNENVHILDAIFVPPRNNSTDNDALKKAILKCGSVNVGYRSGRTSDILNINTSATYQNKTSETSHSVSLVGWDDNYPKENFAKTPPGDGAFIIKNSWGENSGDHGFYYISYYDTSLLNNTFGIGYIIENTERYTKNYQTDLGGYLSFADIYESYKTTYFSYGDDLISAVGTYFGCEGENYTMEIYVNGELKHVQNGTAPYYGYHTVKLTKEIPVGFMDNFTVVMTKNTVPVLEMSRQHYLNGTVFVKGSQGWEDLSLWNMTVSLKVYTKPLSIFTDDLVKIYRNASQFEADINEANQTVTFEINGAVYNRTSDKNGIARIAINLNPGNYTIKTSFNGSSVENTITVLPTLIAQNLVKYYRNASQFYIILINGSGNAVPNVNITMNINGAFYQRTTNENGTARLNINLNPGEYILTALDPLTGLQMSYNITVLPVLTAEDINMTYKDGTQFKVNLVDGTGNPLANVNVTMNINGVFYNRTTDENGTARLNINLMPGEYIITSQYESAAISNKITIIAKED